MIDARPPRDNLVRACVGSFELRSAGGGMPTLTGHAAVFNQWTRIESSWEGVFMERIAPGAFTKTLAETKPKILFDHGQDPQVGNKPLASLESAGEDAAGLFYAGRMLDTSYNRDLIPGLEAGLYGSSFRFSVVKEDFNERAKASDHNPDGIPERTVQEARVFEFGPVVFPAYAGAEAGLRSMTDQYVLRTITADPDRLVRLLASSVPTNRSLGDLAAFLLADKAALQAAIDKLGNGEPLLAQEAELLEAAIEHLEPPEDGDMEMNSAPETGAERDAHSAEPAPATPGDAPTPPARSKPRPISRDEFLAQLQEFNEHA